MFGVWNPGTTPTSSPQEAGQKTVVKLPETTVQASKQYENNSKLIIDHN